MLRMKVQIKRFLQKIFNLFYYHQKIILFGDSLDLYCIFYYYVRTPAEIDWGFWKYRTSLGLKIIC